MKVRAGATLARSKVEGAVAGQAKKMEREYAVVWNVSGGAKTSLAERGVAFEAPLLSGGTFDFSTALGKKPVLLAFWASWCKPCLLEAPQLVALHTKYAKKGVVVVAVSIDERDDYANLRKVVADLKLPYPVPLDSSGEVLAKYAKGASIPLTFVIDRSGAIVYKHQNFEPGDEVGIEGALEEALE